jgi:hypothetical protein
VDFRSLPVPFQAAKYSCAGSLQFPAAIHDRFVEGLRFVLVALAKVEAKQLGLPNLTVRVRLMTQVFPHMQGTEHGIKMKSWWSLEGGSR